MNEWSAVFHLYRHVTCQCWVELHLLCLSLLRFEVWCVLYILHTNNTAAAADITPLLRMKLFLFSSWTLANVCHIVSLASSVSVLLAFHQCWNVFINTQVAVEYEMCQLGTNEVKMPDWLAAVKVTRIRGRCFNAVSTWYYQNSKRLRRHSWSVKCQISLLLLIIS